MFAYNFVTPSTMISAVIFLIHLLLAVSVASKAVDLNLFSKHTTLEQRATKPVAAAYYPDWASDTNAPSDLDFSKFDILLFGQSGRKPHHHVTLTQYVNTQHSQPPTQIRGSLMIPDPPLPCRHSSAARTIAVMARKLYSPLICVLYILIRRLLPNYWYQ